MQTKFEHFATSSMLCSKDAPPRRNGNIAFDRVWEERAFGMALALSKHGHFEWETFRQTLIAVIDEWERAHPNTNENWDYYERWLEALETVLVRVGVIDAEEFRRAIAQTTEAEGPSPDELATADRQER